MSALPRSRAAQPCPAPSPAECVRCPWCSGSRSTFPWPQDRSRLTPDEAEADHPHPPRTRCRHLRASDSPMESGLVLLDPVRSCRAFHAPVLECSFASVVERYEIAIFFFSLEAAGAGPLGFGAPAGQGRVAPRDALIPGGPGPGSARPGGAGAVPGRRSSAGRRRGGARHEQVDDGQGNHHRSSRRPGRGCSGRSSRGPA